jgi:hypothetical protein
MDEAINDLVVEATKLSGRTFWLKYGKRFISLMFKYNENESFEYVYARIEIASGDIYSPSGTKAVGNIFTSKYKGKECIDRDSVIVNKQKLARRLKDFE